MAHSLVSIPRPCSESWGAMTPTAQGRHCATCATEVVDFTRMSEAEILALLAARNGQHMCVRAHVTQLVSVPAGRWRRWVVTGLALLGWHPFAASATEPPQVLPVAGTSAIGANATTHRQIVIRGQVLDGDTGMPLPGMYIFINQTRYGATTDASGRFELVLDASWKPVQADSLMLRIEGRPFDFNTQEVQVDLRPVSSPLELMVKMQAREGRGHIMGKMIRPVLPVKPPRR
ncbi:carboxypeptidase-like regulatory domain-containing protein [Hymenobacter armeniacus]|uniref:Carboxypeptidase-like regulatory domain-containing protein n=1 Tax=Hymenobacter armeniacus TaxID=2771358 RepID=A0ABR8JW83_9BACT|nr:carboxypeptidase-like regulatory domain-containing protein [Hymenobacter armeniacus]MBD2723048.1 carboxypeptidase-like regulatory domain-containing protein [Hymenobacter armeniacus]